MTKIYISLIDKRHITIRGTEIENGAKCYHYKGEGEAQISFLEFKKFYKNLGFKLVKVATNEIMGVK